MALAAAPISETPALNAPPQARRSGSGRRALDPKISMASENQRNDARSSEGEASGAEPETYATAYHAPVLVEQVVRELVTDRAGTYLDATLGGGGHTAALLDALAREGRVLGVDRDAEALAEARTRLAGAVEAGRLGIAQGNFAQLRALVREPVDGILLDLGVSSHQIEVPERGFSFQREGPLDMRMDARGGLTAAAVVNEWSEADLRQLFYDYGEERRAPQVARAVAQARPLQTTEALAEAVRSAAIPPNETKTLARVFQALRIAVNGELEALEDALRAMPEVLREGGRVAVISYHSLEDRRAKRFLRYGNFRGEPLRDLYGHLIAPLEPVVKGPLRASEDEVAANPRARSARLRIAARRSDEAVAEWQRRTAS